MNLEQIRAMAEAERLMDAGEIPWVWAMGPNKQYERLSVTPAVMEILGLEQQQTVNSYIVDAIAELSLEILKEKITIVRQQIEDQQLDPNFDFRKEMDN